MLINQRRNAEARAALQHVLTLDSTFAVARYALGVVLTDTGQFGEAVSLWEHGSTAPGVRRSELRSALALALARAGRAPDARRVIAELQSDGKGRLPPTGALAAALMALSEREAALNVLQQAVDRHDPWLLNYSQSARYDELRKDPRGKALLERTEAP